MDVHVKVVSFLYNCYIAIESNKDRLFRDMIYNYIRM